MTYYIFEVYFFINAFMTYARFNPRTLLVSVTHYCGIILTGDAFDISVKGIQYFVVTILLGACAGIFYRTSSRDLKYASLTIALVLELRFFLKGIWPYISSINLMILFLCFFGDQFDKGLRIFIKKVRELLEHAKVNEINEIPLNTTKKDKGLLTPGKSLRKAMDLDDFTELHDIDLKACGREDIKEEGNFRNLQKKSKKVK